jgi:hypothetical protein
MPSGDLWWARTTGTLVNGVSRGSPVPGFSWRFAPEGVELSGVVVGPTVWATTEEWEFQLRSEYFLDTARMPAQGDAFVSVPRMTFSGGLGLGATTQAGTTFGGAFARVTFEQVLRWDDDEVDRSDVSWPVGFVNGPTLLLGKRLLPPQKRDYPALIFNLDRTRTLSITLLTTFFFRATLGGIIGFGPLLVGIPQWKVYSLD